MLASSVHSSPTLNGTTCFLIQRQKAGLDSILTLFAPGSSLLPLLLHSTCSLGSHSACSLRLWKVGDIGKRMKGRRDSSQGTAPKHPPQCLHLLPCLSFRPDRPSGDSSPWAPAATPLPLSLEPTGRASHYSHLWLLHCPLPGSSVLLSHMYSIVSMKDLLLH